MRNLITIIPFTLAWYMLQAETLPNIQLLKDLNVSQNTEAKPQSKAWKKDGHFFIVMPISTGTWIFKLDPSGWLPVLQLSTAKNTHANVKIAGENIHALLFAGKNSSVASAHYIGNGVYQKWSDSPGLSNLTLDTGVETATLDIDSNGRMWIASDSKNAVNVRYSDFPYVSFSDPITIANGISSDDISVVTALPNREIGVFWSNQKTKRFGFRKHIDGTPVDEWSVDEMPASQSALNKGKGMADDHMHVAVASDGTLYVSVKTSYDSKGFPLIALLVRRPNGQWDPLYSVDSSGTRSIVVLNERTNTIRVIYPKSVNGGDIIYKESNSQVINFGPAQLLIPKGGNNPSSMKDPYSTETIIISSSGGKLKSALLQ